MLGGVCYPRVHELSVGQVRAGFAICAFEGEVWEGCGGCVGGDGAVVGVGGGVVDGCDYRVADLGDVLRNVRMAVAYRKDVRLN